MSYDSTQLFVLVFLLIVSIQSCYRGKIFTVCY